MKITLFAHGTRGDVWPMIAIGFRLTELGHKVTVSAGLNFARFVESAGLRFVPLPLDLGKFLESDRGQKLMASAPLKLATVFQELYHEHRSDFNSSFVTAAEGADALASMTLTFDRAQCVADKMGIPLCMINYYPINPSSEFPSVLIPIKPLPFGFLNRAAHSLVVRMWWNTGRKDIEEFRRYLGLRSSPDISMYRHDHPKALVLNSYSKHVFPRPKDWGKHIKLTGYWQLTPLVRERLGEGIPPALEDWLQAGTAPVYLGFGSMPILEPQQFLNEVVEITRALGLRAVINANWISKGRVRNDLPDHIFFLDGAIDHDRLFTYCLAAVHHGGAGTTAASLRAGLPTMICSLFADQPFWGNRVEQLGVGVHLPFAKLNRTSLARGIRMLNTDWVRARARTLGKTLQKEGDGSEVAANLLSNWLDEKLKHEAAKDKKS